MTVDAIVVGGSFAGLSAALILARARREVLVIDSGLPRNRFAAHSHGVLGQDGIAGAELLRDAFAAWSEHFVNHGIFRQYAHAPVGTVDEGAWFNTGFGRMQAHAVRDVSDPGGDDPPGVELRRATPNDIDAIEPLLHLIQRQLVGSPAWAISLPEAMRTARADWDDELRKRHAAETTLLRP